MLLYRVCFVIVAGFCLMCVRCLNCVVYCLARCCCGLLLDACCLMCVVFVRYLLRIACHVSVVVPCLW